MMPKMSVSSKIIAAALLAMLILVSYGCEETVINPQGDTSSIDLQPAPPVQMVYPNGGEVLTIGSEVTLVALSDSTFSGTVFFKLSLDAGRTWSYELEGASLLFPANHRLEFPVTIPDSITINQNKVSTKSTQCLMMVQCYEPLTIKDVSKAQFTIQ
jgi:hypothetical protein